MAVQRDLRLAKRLSLNLNFGFLNRISLLILQPFRHFTYVTTHSPTLPSLYLRHSSFSSPSVALPTSQFILQPSFRFSYVTGSSLTSPGEPPMHYLALIIIYLLICVFSRNSHNKYNASLCFSLDKITHDFVLRDFFGKTTSSCYITVDNPSVNCDGQTISGHFCLHSSKFPGSS